MGVLNIRTRTERLGNLGQVVAPNLRTGEAEMWGAAGRAVQGLGEVAGKVVGIIGAIQAKEDKRQVDGAVAEGTKALNEMMYNVGSDGSPRGFMVDANDVTKGGSVVPNFEANYETMLSDLKKNRKLTDSQFELVKSSLGQRAEGWRTQMVGRIGETYARSEEQNAAAKANEDFNALVAKPVLDEADWQELGRDLIDPSYIRGNKLVGDKAIKANAQNVILQADKQRKDAWIKSAMAGTETFTTEEQVKNYFANKRKELEKHKFITDGMSASLTKEQKAKAAEAFEDTLKVAENQAIKMADGRLAKIQAQAIKTDKDAFAQIVLHQDEDGFVPPAKEEKLRSIKEMDGLSDDQRAIIYEKWNGYYQRREQFERDQETKHGKLLEYVENGQKKQVYISASAWGKTSATVEARLKDTDYVANNPLDALAEIESLRAIGEISGEDYFAVRKLARAQFDQKTADACSKLFNGKFASIFLAKWGNKGLTEKEYQKGLKTNLYYKYDKDGAGIGSVRNGTLTQDSLRHDDSETNEHVFTMEEKDMLINTVHHLAHRGFEIDKIEQALDNIIRPKERQYYQMTMEARLRDTDFLQSIYALGQLNTKVRTKVSALTHQTGLTSVVETFDPDKKKEIESKSADKPAAQK